MSAPVSESDRRRAATFLPRVRRAMHHGHLRCDDRCTAEAHAVTVGALGRVSGACGELGTHRLRRHDDGTLTLDGEVLVQ